MQQSRDLKQYFENSRAWYQQKYLKPLSERSWTFCAALLFLVVTVIVGFQTYKLFPIATKLRYAITFKGSASDKKISISSANKNKTGPLGSIAQILVENYLTQREKYNYADLDKQLLFIKTNSTKVVFNQYYNFISINNPLSPILRYQDGLTRSVEILETNFDFSKVEVKFRSIARDANNKIQEQLIWLATINFAISQIVIGLPDGAPFDFVVTGYKLKLLKNESK